MISLEQSLNIVRKTPDNRLECVCGSIVQKSGFIKHLGSKSHDLHLRVVDRIKILRNELKEMKEMKEREERELEIYDSMYQPEIFEDLVNSW